jgi:hypothetical protein
VVAVALAVALYAVARGASAAEKMPTAPARRDVLQRYCFTCHNSSARAAGLSLDTIDVDRVGANAAVWEKVVRKLRGRAMPPLGQARPDEATYRAITAALEADLDRAARLAPNPGRPLLHRLNRTEYANAIRDVLALDIGDVTSLLPADDSSFGFDNVADVLGVSPVLIERYLSAASRISALAVGDLDVTPGAETYRARQDRSQDRHIEGLPLGTVGGLLVHRTFPVDGEYLLSTTLLRSHTNSSRGLHVANRLEISIDGERVFVTTVGGDRDLDAWLAEPVTASDAIDARLKVRVPIKAGPHDVGVAFVEPPPVADTRPLQSFLRSSADPFDSSGAPHIATLTVTGPYNATGPGETPSRRRIFVCRVPDQHMRLASCPKEIIATVARRAYRQPVSDADVESLMAFYRAGASAGGFEAGIERALQRILMSPRFMFRAEREPESVPSGTPYRISDLELASRLSFFLWSSVPDDELIEVASRGGLSDPRVLQRQVARMLADARADALALTFAGQWLQLRNLQNMIPDSVAFPDFDDTLREAFGREAELFFASIMRDDRSVLELLSANYTFVNERLAKHYGIANVYGSQFRRVTLDDEARRGLLGKGAVLLVTSHADRTSPVLRGKWILENILGVPPPPPPPNVPALGEDDKAHPRTMREQMEVHRRNPACANCHRLMDPMGLAMENFDVVGSWRSRDAGQPIDASGQLLDGSKIDGVVTLREALLRRPDTVVSSLTEKLLTYALGRGLEAYDMPAVRAIVRATAEREYRFSSLVLGIVNSVPFQMRTKR